MEHLILLMVAAGPAGYGFGDEAGTGVRPVPDAAAGVVAWRREVGYQSRACGFDMNRNGVIGEAADAQVGNGRTEDPDGDGTAEDLIYVDAEGGSDAAGDGSASHPFRTLQRALDACDGPGDGAEDIVCIHGVFHEQIETRQGGVPGHYGRDGFQFPRNPMMIIGWDRDGDGEYPPHDPDDLAVLDGSTPSGRNLSMAVSNRQRNASCLEIAHLTIRNYGHDAGSDGKKIPRGAFAPASGGSVSHIYLHDVKLESINESTHTDGYGHVVYLWIGNRTRFTWFAFANNLVDGFSGYGFRGTARNGSGHFRLQGNTFKFTRGWYKYSGRRDLGQTWKVWSSYSHLEFIDNHCMADPEGGVGISGVGFGVRPEVQDVVIRGNLFEELKVGVGVDGYSSGYTFRRPVDRVAIEGNVIINRRASGIHPIGIRIADGENLAMTVNDVRIANNLLVLGQPNASGIYCDAGNDEAPQVGTITVEGNRFHGPGKGHGYAAIRLLKVRAYPQEAFVVRNNVFADTGPENYHIEARHPREAWVEEGNTYEPPGRWRWGQARTATIEAWRAEIGRKIGPVQTPQRTPLQWTHFQMKQHDDQGRYLWSRPENWHNGVPHRGLACEIGDDSSGRAMHCVIRSDAFCHSLELAEHARTEGSSLRLEKDAVLTITAGAVVSKDREGWFYIDGAVAALSPRHTLRVGGPWGRPEAGLPANGHVIIGPTGELEAWFVGINTDHRAHAIPSSPWGPRFWSCSTDTEIVVNGGRLIAHQGLRLSTTDAERPGALRLRGAATFQIDPKGTHGIDIWCGVWEIDGAHVKIEVGDVEFWGNKFEKAVHTRTGRAVGPGVSVLKLTGSGVSTIHATNVDFVDAALLDVGGLNTPPGVYKVIDADSITRANLRLAPGMDVQLWAFRFDFENGDLLLIRKSVGQGTSAAPDPQCKPVQTEGGAR